MPISARTPKSEAALKAALDVIGPCHERTSALLMFLASGRLLADVFAREEAANLAYWVADQLATGKPI